MPNIGDMKILKPRRGNKTVMNQTRAGLVLERGEIFLEFEGEIGSSNCKIKIGDGITGYSNLPYAIGEFTASSNMSNVEGILPIEHGGTGNPYGFIITGMIEDYTRVLNDLRDQYTAVVNAFNAQYVEGASPSNIWAELEPSYPIIGILNIDTSDFPPYEGTGYSADVVIKELENTEYYDDALAYTSANIGLGTNATAEGLGTKASGDNQSVLGKYNIADNYNTYAFIIGNGTGDTHRSNAFTIDWQGNGIIAGNFKSNGNITANNYNVGNKTLERWIKDLLDSGLIDSISHANNADVAQSVDWDGVQNKPNEFEPTNHSHSMSDISDFSLDGYSIGHADNADEARNAVHADSASNADSVSWNNVNNKPVKFEPSDHQHKLGDIIGWQEPAPGSIENAVRLVTARELQVDLANISQTTRFDGSADVTNIKVGGILDIRQGGTGNENGAAKCLETARVLKVNLANVENQTTFDGSADVNNIQVDGILPKIKGGTGNTYGGATKLVTPRILKTNLGTIENVTFDGSEDTELPVTGILKYANGGTGNSRGYIQTGDSSHTAGPHSTVEGENNSVPGDYSYATGKNNAVTGDYSAAIGYNNKVTKNYSLAVGIDNEVTANYAVAMGYNNKASSPGQTIIGINANSTPREGNYDINIQSGVVNFDNWNDPANSDALGTMFAIGDGVEGASYDSTTGSFTLGDGAIAHNCFRVVPFTYKFRDDEDYNIQSSDFTGGIYFYGRVHYNGADYAEMFEWRDGNKDNEDRVGRFVTLDGDKIIFANSETDVEDILGIVSANPSIIGDAGSENWSEMYETDIFGRLKYKEGFTIPEHTEILKIKTENGIEEREVVIPEKTCMERKISDKYDPDHKYVPRAYRKEWATIGLLGKLVMVDDGTAQVNGFVKPSDRGGIATKSNTRTPYRVMARLDAAHIKVYVKP